MALPERLEFDLESAAAYLGCTTSDILYYLDKGLLRLAVSADPSFPEFFFFSFEKLSTEQQQTLKSFNNPDGIELQQVMLDLVPSSVRPYIAPYTAPLYLSQYQRNQIKYTRHELGEAIWILENFRGERITRWHEGRLWGYWLKEENGWIADTCLAREELDRLNTSPEPEPELKPETVSDDATKKVWRFQLPNQADDIAIAIVDYGNRYIKEKKGHRPTLKDLQGYMLLVGRDSLQLKYDSKGKDYIFGDKPLSERAFRTRYKNYLKPE
jgi:hypothetical protein